MATQPRTSGQPSISYSITVRLELPAGGTAISRLTTCVEAAGGIVTALDVTASGHDRLRIDVTCAASDTAHADRIVEALRNIEGVAVHKVSDRTFLMHLGGTIQMETKHPIRNRDDLSMVYTPGVARVCEAIVANPEDARRLTVKRNAVAVVTDGSAVLGLGNIGPAAALPVMEGKSALFKRFAGIDAWPLCLDTASRASTWRTSRLRGASRSSGGCGRRSTSRSSTTTSTAPRSWCSPRSPTRCGWSARTRPRSGW
jgi:malate dehydrogenase (oxaloacetate-decarboxylating)